jgi:hypothetical protein
MDTAASEGTFSVSIVLYVFVNLYKTCDFPEPAIPDLIRHELIEAAISTFVWNWA